MKTLKKYKKIIIVIEVIALFMILYDFIIDSGSVTELSRPEKGEGKVIEELDFSGGERNGSLEVPISERKLSSDEEEEEIALAKQEIDETLMGKNESIDEVYLPLDTRSSYASSKVQAFWTFEPMVVDAEGNIDFKDEDELLIEARADLVCGETQDRYISYVRAVRPGNETKNGFLFNLKSALNKADSEGGDTLMLPSSVLDSPVSFKRKPDFRGLAFAFIGIALIPVLILFDRKKDEKKKKAYNDALSKDYPIIASKLSLLVGAGIRPREAFKRMSTSYEENRRRGAPRAEGFEEIERACRDMEKGVGEGDAYLSIAERTGHKDYRRLTLLLTENMRKGDRFLSAELSREEADAFEERKNRAIRLGEEASTKLVFPMILLLGSVMIMLLVPAFLGTGI